MSRAGHGCNLCLKRMVEETSAAIRLKSTSDISSIKNTSSVHLYSCLTQVISGEGMRSIFHFRGEYQLHFQSVPFVKATGASLWSKHRAGKTSFVHYIRSSDSESRVKPSFFWYIGRPQHLSDVPHWFIHTIPDKLHLNNMYNRC